MRCVDGDARLLHLDEHVGKRHLDLREELAHTEAVELIFEERAKTLRRDRPRARAGDALVEGRDAMRVLAIGDRQQRHLELQTFGREALDVVIAAARVH